MTEQDDEIGKRAYLAGIVDGEGHIGIYRRNSSTETPRYYPVIRVEMSDRLPLELISNNFGGKIYTVKPRGNKYKTTFVHESFETNRITKLTHYIYPYLKVKKKQAEVILEVLHLKNQAPSRCCKIGKQKAAELNDIMHEMFLKIRQLNHASIPYQ